MAVGTEPRRCSVSWVILLAIAVTSLGGCSQVRHYGDVYVSSTPPMNWNIHGQSFQPRFSLTEKEALQRAVATTAQVERSILDAVQAAARVRVVGGAVEGFDTADAVDPSSLGAPGAPPSFTPAASILNSAKLEIDPRLQYLLATALWQEVQVINRFINEVRFEAPDGVEYSPQLFRLRISSTPATVRSSYTTKLAVNFRSLSDGGCTDSISTSAPIKLVPFLINDHIEAALASRRDEEIRRLSLALAAMFKGVGLGIDLDSFRQEVDRSLVREFNSLLTVTPAGIDQDAGATRLAVHIGPRRVGIDSYRASGEPRFITVLALIPFPTRASSQDTVTNRPGDQRRKVQIEYNAKFVDPVSGSEILASGVETSGTFSDYVRRPAYPWLGNYQSALAYDDGNTTEVVLTDAQGFVPEDVSATWFFKDASSGSATLHALDAGETTFDGVGTALKFQFPSLSRMGIDPVASGVPQDIARLGLSQSTAVPVQDRSARTPSTERTFVIDLTARKDSDNERFRLFFPWVYKAAKVTDRAKGFTFEMPAISSADPRIGFRAGEAVLKCEIKIPTDPATNGPSTGFYVQFSEGVDVGVKSGGDVAAVEPKNPRRYKLLKSGSVEFTIRGLVDKKKFTVSPGGPSRFAVPAAVTITAVPVGTPPGS